MNLLYSDTGADQGEQTAAEILAFEQAPEQQCET